MIFYFILHFVSRVRFRRGTSGADTNECMLAGKHRDFYYYLGYFIECTLRKSLLNIDFLGGSVAHG